MKFAVGLVVCVLVLASDAKSFVDGGVFSKREEVESTDFKMYTFEFVKPSEIKELQTALVDSSVEAVGTMKAASEVAQKGIDGTGDSKVLIMEIIGIMNTLQEDFGVVYEKSQTILMRAFYAGVTGELDRCIAFGITEKGPETDTVCSIRILYDMAAKDREAMAELVNSDMIVSSNKCSALNDYVAASRGVWKDEIHQFMVYSEIVGKHDEEWKGSAGVGLFKSMKKDQECLAKHFMSYKEIVGKLDEEWKESGRTADATRKGLMKNQIVIMSLLDLTKKTLKPFRTLLAPPGDKEDVIETEA